MITRPHGVRAKYSIEGCRCRECTRANADYQRSYMREKAPRTVNADPVREHLAALRGQGWTFPSLAARSGYSADTLKGIAYRHRRVRETTALDILSMPITPVSAVA